MAEPRCNYRGGMSDRDELRPDSWYNTEPDYSTSSLDLYNIAPPAEEIARRNKEYAEEQAQKK